MTEITFLLENGESVQTFANVGDNLLEIARNANVAIDAPCSGNGACGKCLVRLVEGELDSLRTKHITEEDYALGWRLSCSSRIANDEP
ncbi:MAG: 2Fe-2S iron-sulfur cluster binding domain-containing protein, partial [Lachnospiraceae bacterium]|nr:2Fe-2S iron-sulfur cluster binding domain-containing protein [Lachnospiraceae bacterium]